MKIVIFAGTPGSGKTSIIKHVINKLKEDFKLLFIKFDCLRTQDDELIAQKCNVDSEKRLAQELCPDHYQALELSRIIREYQDRDLIIIETAGLCLRCSPYIKEGLGINVLDIMAGSPNRYGPILTQADIVAVSKCDLISQAEREIFRINILDANSKAKIVEVNGLTGEGAYDIADYIKYSINFTGQKLTLKHSMPSAICGYCYGCSVIDPVMVHNRFLMGKDLKALVPNLNCGRCGYKTCNEFIRAVLDNKVIQEACPFVKNKLKEKLNEK
ncbi:MAG: Cobalamin synthesis protein P47K [candidate division TM6 bacterium GW2011_GWF2_28_16]|nr:MAG: Cobalamin synthesis protein P47K [candidate division TM6 bacterium GW2011_GWF2_28_16]